MNNGDGSDNRGTLKQAAKSVWTVDDMLTNAAGLRLPVRMTVIRLLNGDLLLHSPTRYSLGLHQELEKFGTIRYLLAPNSAHWMFAPSWQRLVPNVITMAAPGLAARGQVRKAGLRIDRELRGDAPDEWAEEIQTVLFAVPFFSEIVLFHRPSGTLVLTDLVLNIRPEELSFWPRIFARLVGSTAPNGRAPVYLRMLLRRGGHATQQAAVRLIRFSPSKVIFAHGDWFREDATERLRCSLRWLAGEAVSGEIGR